MTYLDTSALVKRFFQEKGTTVVNSFFTTGEPIATATIAFIEVHAALSRKKRYKKLKHRPYVTCSGQFDKEYESFVRVELQQAILELARNLVKQHSLRSLDAIHLASALDLQMALQEPVVFAAADSTLIKIAAAVGLNDLHVEMEETKRVQEQPGLARRK